MTTARRCFARRKDSVLIVDLANPENPKIIANLPLKNSVFGPPVNVAIDPTNSIGWSANSINVAKDGGTLKIEPDNKVYVIDLKAGPPKLAGTVTVGKQPSGSTSARSATWRSLPIAPTSRSACCP